MNGRIKFLALAAAISVLSITSTGSNVFAENDAHQMDEFTSFANTVINDEFDGNYKMVQDGSSIVVTSKVEMTEMRETRLMNMSGMLYDAMGSFGINDGHVVIDIEDANSENSIALFADGKSGR